MKTWSFGKGVFAVFLGVFLAIAAVCGFFGWQLRLGAQENERQKAIEEKTFKDQSDADARKIERQFKSTRPDGR